MLSSSGKQKFEVKRMYFLPSLGSVGIPADKAKVFTIAFLPVSLGLADKNNESLY